jgi:hypothetical protein
LAIDDLRLTIEGKGSLTNPSRQSAIGNRQSLRFLSLLPYATFALLATVSWNRWIEPYVDTGRELMVPWRLAQGERLYAEIHFHHGPLAPYLGAAIDRSAGRCLPARTGLALGIALLHLAALRRLLRGLLPAGRAALTTAIAVAAAIFLRPGGWLFPFSFDMAIAVAVLTWALVFATRAQTSRADGRAGVCLLLALLARPELAVAGLLLVGLTVLREPRRLFLLALFPFTAAAAVYGIVSAGIPPSDLVADGWLRMIDPPAAYANVYRAYAGLDRIGLRSAELLLAAIVLAILAALLVAAAFMASRAGAGSRTVSTGVMIAATAVLVALAALRLRPPTSLAETVSLFPPLPRVIPISLAAAAVLRLLVRLGGRQPRGPLGGVPDAVVWMAALFGSRIFLAAGYVGPYDAYFLPLPLTVAITGLYALADRAAPAVGAALPRLTSAALAVFLTFRVAAIADLYRRGAWSHVVTPAGGLWLPEPEGVTTRQALADLQNHFPAHSTLTGFPEGGFFNYVLGRRNPFWLDQFFPGHLDGAGEARAVALFDDRPPDVILYANVLAVGEGSRVFGRDYLARLDEEVRSRSRVVSIHGPGARPGARIGDPDFFVEIRVPIEPAAR